jgi:hypothetical protein
MEEAAGDLVVGEGDLVVAEYVVHNLNVAFRIELLDTRHRVVQADIDCRFYLYTMHNIFLYT